MRGFRQTCQIGIALPFAVMNRIRRQIGGYLRTGADGRNTCLAGMIELSRALPDLALLTGAGH